MGDKLYILNKSDIDNKLTRLAYEIIERNVEATQLTLAGIFPNGGAITNRLQQLIEQLSTIKVTTLSISLNKKSPAEITLEPSINKASDTIIIVDDVSMTGKTILYALQPFLQLNPQKIQTLVLVERQQKNFPIHSDYVGLHISTTLQETIIVEQDNGILTGAYLI
jgi:pyrimidine operon attenuation protein / uracil phosphoribosyltransferase